MTRARLPRSIPTCCRKCTLTGARPITCRSARSICGTIHCSSAARRAHIKPRLLGHWGTTPGLNFIYVHLNRVIRAHDLNMIYIIGPGHGGPGLVANTYLEGSYTELYPRDERRIARASGKNCFGSFRGRTACRATSRPRSRARSTRAASSAIRSRTRTARGRSTIPNYGRVHRRRRRSGNRRARRELALEQIPESGARRRVLPILHLNGYKIANPTVLARIRRRRTDGAHRGYGYEPLLRRGRRSRAMHQAIAATLDQPSLRSAISRASARAQRRQHSGRAGR